MIHVFPHPNAPIEADIYYVDAPDQLAKLPAAVRALVKRRTLAAFRRPERLLHLAEGGTGSFRSWVARLLRQRRALAIVSAGADSSVDENGDLDAGRAFLTFIDGPETKKPWNYHCAIALSLDVTAPRLALPEALRPVAALGRIYFQGWFGSGSTCFQSTARWPVTHYPDYWRELATAYPDVPVAKLVAFYEDSGQHLLVDPDERVWLGGIEHGGIDAVPLPLPAVIDRLFAELRPSRDMWTALRPAARSRRARRQR